MILPVLDPILRTSENGKDHKFIQKITPCELRTHKGSGNVALYRVPFEPKLDVLGPQLTVIVALPLTETER